MPKDYIAELGKRAAEFYAFMIFAILGIVVMAAANELMTLYIGLELMTISFYILTAYPVKMMNFLQKAGLKYLILGAISSAILLFSMSLVYTVSGTTVIIEITANLRLEPVLVTGIILLVAGFAFKISLFLPYVGAGYLSREPPYQLLLS